MNSLTRKSITTGALLGALAVALGAFGTHGLQPRLELHYFEVFETAVRYQMYHAIALIMFGLVSAIKPLPNIIYTLFLFGVVVFSATLYGIVISSLTSQNSWKLLGAITPIGGASLILAWSLFAYHSYKK